MDHNPKVSGKSEWVTMETFEKLGDLIWNDSARLAWLIQEYLYLVKK